MPFVDEGRSEGLSLRRAWEQATARALAEGALEPIATHATILVDDGVRFVVRVVEALQRKAAAAGARPADFNPFLPYDPAMFVADVSASHVALLNRFPVLPLHLLFVTRAFESQEAPLTLADMEALALGLAAVDGLGFYNGGEVAGASQRHKHLQVIDLPLADGERGVPLEAVYGSGPDGLRTTPFPHARVALDGLGQGSIEHAAEALRDAWRRASALLWGAAPPGPYNLLVTRRWLVVVPRRQERFEAMSVNALGFAGALLVKREQEVARIREVGPMALLRSLSGLAP